ncbi:hypothetical protein IFM89_023253 [Coptis chinensis]|uniref:RRM domain-containing protein n=1 Tax=Coptis chinensis TaxID=261450 RepID=A0A835LSR0_9MAGN|nr:hypothetical protein IFM89_023253 [Coptis chinensis]
MSKQSWTLKYTGEEKGSGMRTGYVHERQHGGVLELGRVRVAWLGRYGPIVEIDLKRFHQDPPGYAFVEFEDSIDAKMLFVVKLMVMTLMGIVFGWNLRMVGEGNHLRLTAIAVTVVGVAVVESLDVLIISVWVSGLPPSASLLARPEGTTGVVDYTNYEDMRYAVHKLDDSEFRNAFSRGYIRVREYESRRSYSRSPTHSRSYSRSRSPSYTILQSIKSNRALSRSRSRSVSSRSPSVSEPEPGFLTTNVTPVSCLIRIKIQISIAICEINAVNLLTRGCRLWTSYSPSLHHAGVLLENSDFGLERDLGPDENFQQSEQVDLSHFDQVPSTSHQECNLVTNTITPCNTTTWSLYDDLYFDTVYDVSEMKEEVVQPVLGDEELSGVVVKVGDFSISNKKRKKCTRSIQTHLATGVWNLNREPGNKLLASRFRGDCLYICDWPGCVHTEEKRSYKLFRGVFKNFKKSQVWRTINDGNRSKISLDCAFCNCKETWDLHSAFCLKRVFGFHDDGEPVVRAYVCENGHVSGAWTDRPMYS